MLTRRLLVATDCVVVPRRCSTLKNTELTSHPGVVLQPLLKFGLGLF